MQGRHCNFYNTQRINGSRTHLFAHDKAKCAIESAIASFFAPHIAPFSPVLSLSEILLNHVSAVTLAAALVLAPDSFVRTSAPLCPPLPSSRQTLRHLYLHPRLLRQTFCHLCLRPR